MQTPDDFSPAAKFMIALRGYFVMSKRTGQLVPRFILWAKHKESQHDIEQIKNRTYYEYIYIPKVRLADGSFADTLQV